MYRHGHFHRLLSSIFQHFHYTAPGLMGFVCFPGRVFESWQWSSAAVATVVNNIWACYLSSELENILPKPATCSLDFSSRHKPKSTQEGRRRIDRMEEEWQWWGRSFGRESGRRQKENRKEATQNHLGKVHWERQVVYNQDMFAM